MSPIRYVARIYTSDNSYTDYKFFARSKEEAKRVARELFFNEHGVDATKIGIKADLPSDVEKTHINQRLVSVISELKNMLIDKTYDDFIKMFVDFDGWDLILSPNSKSFMIKFSNFTCRIDYNDGRVSLNESEILYYSVEYNRTYSIRDYCMEIYIAVG